MSIESSTFVLYEEIYPQIDRHYKVYLQYSGNEDMLHRLNTICEAVNNHFSDDDLANNYIIHLDNILTYSDLMALCVPKIVTYENNRTGLLVERIIIHPGKLVFPFLEEAEEYDINSEDHINKILDVILDNITSGEDDTDKNLAITKFIQ